MKQKIRTEVIFYLLAVSVSVVLLVIAATQDTPKKPSAVPDLVEKTGEHFTKGAIRAIKDELTPPETLTTD